MEISVALSQLNVDNDSHWTQAGLPATAVVSELVGDVVTRSDIEQAAAGFTREVFRSYLQQQAAQVAQTAPQTQEQLQQAYQDTNDALEKSRVAMEKANAAFVKAQQELDAATKEHVAIVEKINAEKGPQAKQQVIVDFLASEQREREALQARRDALLKSGVDLNELLGLLKGLPCDTVEVK